jgi:lipoic acid synthetase
MATDYKRKPEWLKINIEDPKKVGEVKKLIGRMSLHTVCKEANCPNLMECFASKTATFMIMGGTCTRNCAFCDVSFGRPDQLDLDEPLNLATAAKEMGLRHIVITSVTRDDLSDGGASHFKNVVLKTRELNPKSSIEVLTPDFKGDIENLKTVLSSKPEIFNHNLETVRRLTPEIRFTATYDMSLEVLRNSKTIAPNIYTKSGIMVGLGETIEEVHETLKDLRNNHVDFITIGQYLRPSKNHPQVEEYITPDQFKAYEEYAYSLGFKHVASGPFVRSSYKALDALV